LPRIPPKTPTNWRIVGEDRRVEVPVQLVSWLDAADSPRVAHLFPLCWWNRAKIPEIHQLGIWMIVDLEGKTCPSFDGWQIPPDLVLAPDESTVEVLVRQRLLFRLEVRCRTPRSGPPVWRFPIPEELLETGCLPKHPDSLIVVAHESSLTVWRPSAWKACGPLWPDSFGPLAK
jgi:hypothetical protein